MKSILLSCLFALACYEAGAQTFSVPQNAPFNQTEALKMVNGGSAVIKGKVFARDNQAGGIFKGMAVLNINPKQYAPPGTEIFLFPYTPYFQEYLEVSKKYAKKGKVVELPAEALACIKATRVTDEQGHYEFTNLTPGEFFLFTSFGYVHTSTATETVGQTDHYVNGVYQGSNPITQSYSVNNGSNAVVEKRVRIEETGEVKEADLKKTR